jgi:hypothetical protein
VEDMKNLSSNLFGFLLLVAYTPLFLLVCYIASIHEVKDNWYGLNYVAENEAYRWMERNMPWCSWALDRNGKEDE